MQYPNQPLFQPITIGGLHLPNRIVIGEEHVEGWRGVTDAVHRAGGKIFAAVSKEFGEREKAKTAKKATLEPQEKVTRKTPAA